MIITTNTNGTLSLMLSEAETQHLKAMLNGHGGPVTVEQVLSETHDKAAEQLIKEKYFRKTTLLFLEELRAMYGEAWIDVKTERFKDAVWRHKVSSLATLMHTIKDKGLGDYAMNQKNRLSTIKIYKRW